MQDDSDSEGSDSDEDMAGRATSRAPPVNASVVSRDSEEEEDVEEGEASTASEEGSEDDDDDQEARDEEAQCAQEAFAALDGGTGRLHQSKFEELITNLGDLCSSL